MSHSTGLIDRFQEELRLRDYRPNTIRTYRSALVGYERWLGSTHPQDATLAQVQAYLLHLLEGGRSDSMVDQVLSALKFLYVEVIKRCTPREFTVSRPRRNQVVPQILSREQVLELAEAVPNRRHRLAILLLYAAGLRVSELVAANVGDVDFAALSLHVSGETPTRDRLTVVSPRLEEDLRWICGSRPPGAPLIPAREGTRWSARSVQHVVERAAARTGIRASCHTLRHSFAAHLLEDGADLPLVQQLLGHARIETTTRYSQTRNASLSRVRSPL